MQANGRVLACAALANLVWAMVACGGGQTSANAPSPASSVDSTAADMPPSAPAPVTSSAPTAPVASSPPAGTATTPAASAPPDRNLNDIRATIQSNRDRFRACYDQALKKHPGIEGKLVMRFVVNPDGTLKSADIDRAASQIQAEDLDACALAVIKTLKFTPSKKGMESSVNYPFDFHPKGPPVPKPQ